MSGRLIALGKQLGVCLVGVGETWRHLFANIVIRVTVSEATSMCQKEQLCDGLKAVIDNECNRVKEIWDTKSPMEYWGFILVDAKNLSNDINQIGMLWAVQHF